MSDDEACILTEDEMENYDRLMADFDAHISDMSREELMAEVRYWHGRAYLMGAFRDRLMRRCAMLRELIMDLWPLYYHGSDCTECPKSVHDECERLASGGCSGSFIMKERMRALGIEVE